LQSLENECSYGKVWKILEKYDLIWKM